jgi:hypothetical protein
MKKGKQLGEYSFKATSNRVRDDDKLEINMEGTVSGFRLRRPYDDRDCRERTVGRV